ncbi:hypothetical protein KF282_1310 [Lactococcus lactis subsp. lactis]|uniref:Uncharacterized protein n=1 Tax=Lactococcus lactis subsp. lactis TaxID=1360 RepID=A0A0V8CXL3_LACLL|nr:hypothetical protein [Lactococcus lactis]KSU06060.1 hypothetical protein KF282_1310 [Lactococcus lactis subsp. lactis]
MKLSEIEAVSPEDFVVFEDGMPYSYVIDRWYKTGAKEVDDFPKLYTSEQMQEYAKECVREAYKEIVKNSYVSDDRVEQAGLNEIINKVFEEDTKND